MESVAESLTILKPKIIIINEWLTKSKESIKRQAHFLTTISPSPLLVTRTVHYPFISFFIIKSVHLVDSVFGYTTVSSKFKFIYCQCWQNWWQFHSYSVTQTSVQHQDTKNGLQLFSDACTCNTNEIKSALTRPFQRWMMTSVTMFHWSE